MAAGIVFHNITTASGVTFALAQWVPDTSSPDALAKPVTMLMKSDGTLADPTLFATSAKQDTGNTSLASLVTALPAFTRGAGAVDAGTQRIVITSDQLSDPVTVAQLMSAGYAPVALPTDQPLLNFAVDGSKIGNGASGTVLTPKFAVISASSSGVTPVVAAVTSKRIRVIACKVVANAAVNFKWQSLTTASPPVPTDITGLSYDGAQGDGEVLGFNPVGWFQTASGEGLGINLSGSVAVGGHLTYVEV